MGWHQLAGEIFVGSTDRHRQTQVRVGRKHQPVGRLHAGVGFEQQSIGRQPGHVLVENGVLFRPDFLRTGADDRHPQVAALKHPPRVALQRQHRVSQRRLKIDRIELRLAHVPPVDRLKLLDVRTRFARHGAFRRPPAADQGEDRLDRGDQHAAAQREQRHARIGEQPLPAKKTGGDQRHRSGEKEKDGKQRANSLPQCHFDTLQIEVRQIIQTRRRVVDVLVGVGFQSQHVGPRTEDVLPEGVDADAPAVVVDARQLELDRLPLDAIIFRFDNRHRLEVSGFQFRRIEVELEDVHRHACSTSATAVILAGRFECGRATDCSTISFTGSGTSSALIASVSFPRSGRSPTAA